LRPAVSARPAFTVGPAAYTWEDVARAAALWSDWAGIERRAHAALASRRRLERTEADVAAADLEERARRFRFARRLFAADELRAWLERWDLGVEEWREYLRGSLLRERRAGEPEALQASRAPRGADVEPFVYVEAVCSGDLERAAEKLAGRAAAFAREGHVEKGDARALEEAYERLRRASVTPEGLRREVEAHRLEWIRVEVEELVVAAETAGREALLALRDEGREMAAVARDAGTEVRRTRRYLHEMDGEVARAVLGLAEGELVGPLEVGGQYVLVRVHSKVPPSIDDPAIRARAEAALVDVALRRETANRVRWHEQR
jgi:hypothetical protein